MPLRVVYFCKAGCGYKTIITEDFGTLSSGGWATIEGHCPGCGADQFTKKETSTKRQFRPDGISAELHAQAPPSGEGQMKDDQYKALLKGGGPAFPVSWTENDGQHVAVGGMTLRDWFASQALGAMLAGAASIPVSITSPTLDDIAEKSYLLADAMLKERGA